MPETYKISEFKGNPMFEVLTGINKQTGEEYWFKFGLDKLATLAGVMWSPSLCREIRDPNIAGRIAYEAVGGVRKPDGTPYFISKIYAMDIEVEREKLVALHKGDEAKVKNGLLQKKSNIAT